MFVTIMRTSVGEIILPEIFDDNAMHQKVLKNFSHVHLSHQIICENNSRSSVNLTFIIITDFVTISHI